MISPNETPETNDNTSSSDGFAGWLQQAADTESEVKTLLAERAELMEQSPDDPRLQEIAARLQEIGNSTKNFVDQLGQLTTDYLNDPKNQAG